MKVRCLNCGEEIERIPSRAKRGCYCNNGCQMQFRYKTNKINKFEITKKAREARTKKAIQRFKTNPKIHISKRGYKMIYIPTKGTKKYHHFIWEKTHPPVQKGFVLHHINFNKLDNKMENLKLMNGREHNSLHTTISNEQNKEKFRQYALTRQRDKFGRFLSL